jgi:hypothetical protein
MDTIDHRYAVADEPQMFRALLNYYQSEGVFGGQLLLCRRTNATAAQLEDMQATSAGFGSYIDVPPAGGVVFARVTAEPSLLGRLLNLAYRPAPLYLRFRFGDGRQSDAHRFIAGTGPGGIFVSTYLADVHDLDLAWHGQFRRPITALQVSTPDVGQYSPQYRVVFIRYRATEGLLKRARSAPEES